MNSGKTSFIESLFHLPFEPLTFYTYVFVISVRISVP
ncbi:hypothetical protein CCP2SC5_440031 [Azospirillaceae bacterium]